MRVRTGKSEPGTRFYIIKIYYDTKGIEHTGTVEKPGSEQEIREKTGRDLMEWAKERAAFLTEQEKPENRNISIDFSHSSLITKNYRYTFSSSGFFTIPVRKKSAPQFRRTQTGPLTLQIYFRSSVTTEFLNHVPKQELLNSPKRSFSSRILMFIRCTPLRMFSVKTLRLYSQSFTVTHLNSEKEKQGQYTDCQIITKVNMKKP